MDVEVHSIYYKKLKRDPFHRSIPYPNGCSDIVDQLHIPVHFRGRSYGGSGNYTSVNLQCREIRYSATT
jgi:hypothetical protein